MVDSYGMTLGFMELDAQAVFPPNWMHNSHEHALKLINTECKHEQDIMHHEHKYHRGYVDFVSTTCTNMRQVKPLESFKGGYHPIILHHSHLKIHVDIQDKPL